MRPTRRYRQQRHTLLQLIPLLIVILVALIVVACVIPKPQQQAQTPGTSLTTQPSHSTSATQTTQSTTAPTDPTESTNSQPTDPTESTAPTDPTESTAPTGPAEPVDLESFFAESVFIGDSVTLKLRNYTIAHPDALYGAKILCAGSYAVRHAIVDPDPGNKDIVSITYQGVGVRPEDALREIGAKRVFIMLGMNDIVFGIDYTIGNWQTLIDNIRAECPDIEIYIQSGTPIHATKDSDTRKLNNANMDAYNQRLEEFCQENGCYYVELNSYFKDENGDLADIYCSDPYDKEKNPNGQGCHFTDAGVELWIRLLKEYVSNQ